MTINWLGAWRVQRGHSAGTLHWYFASTGRSICGRATPGEVLADTRDNRCVRCDRVLRTRAEDEVKAPPAPAASVAPMEELPVYGGAFTVAVDPHATPPLISIPQAIVGDWTADQLAEVAADLAAAAAWAMDGRP